MRAKIEQLGNAIFWRYYDSGNKKMIIWQGCTDRFWWKNISKTDQFRINNGFYLDPDVNEVTIIENK